MSTQDPRRWQRIWLIPGRPTAPAICWQRPDRYEAWLDRLDLYSGPMRRVKILIDGRTLDMRVDRAHIRREEPVPAPPKRAAYKPHRPVELGPDEQEMPLW